MTKLYRCFREKICCGTIFRGPFGETVIDSRFLTPCSNRNDGLKSGLRCLTSEMEAAKRLQQVGEVTAAAGHRSQEEVVSTTTTTTTTKVVTTTPDATPLDDEGFFDKNVASPSSVGGASSSRSVCSGASESGTTSPPPNVEEEEMMEEVRKDINVRPEVLSFHFSVNPECIC